LKAALRQRLQDTLLPRSNGLLAQLARYGKIVLAQGNANRNPLRRSFLLEYTIESGTNAGLSNG
jgi:hypothetical protein